MWGPLQHPRHVKFYEEWHAGEQAAYGGDWMPMIRAVQYLQSLASAPRLYAFTSLWRFHLTTAPTYEECHRHCSVTIVWRVRDRHFHLAFGRLADGWLEDRPPEQICGEAAFPVVVQPFIQRLLAAKPESAGDTG